MTQYAAILVKLPDKEHIVRKILEYANSLNVDPEIIKVRLNEHKKP